jgi:dihydrodipicolinate synthase/N-acetylneuraminate lyase
MIPDVSEAVRPEGIWAPVLLPLTRERTIDWPALAEEVSILAESGVRGVYTNGTASEFHSQSEDEFDRISDLVASQARRAGLPFQLGISCTNARVARDRLTRAARLDPSAVQFILPDWWPPSLEEILEFVTGLASTAPAVPLILYNPPHAKARLTIKEIAAIRAKTPALIGAKLPGGDQSWYDEVRSTLPDFSVFVPGHRIASGRIAGASGSYSNVACLSPSGAVRWWRQIEEAPDAALDLEQRINAFLAEHVIRLRGELGLSDAGLDKAMAMAGGWGPVDSRLLWPYRGAPENAVAAISAAARRDLPELFS